MFLEVLEGGWSIPNFRKTEECSVLETLVSYRDGMHTRSLDEGLQKAFKGLQRDFIIDVSLFFRTLKNHRKVLRLRNLG